MPEKGWKSLTVRESTHKTLVDRSKREHVTLDELVTRLLAVDGQPKPEREGRKAKEVGVRVAKHALADLEGWTPQLDRSTRERIRRGHEKQKRAHASSRAAERTSVVPSG